MKSPFLLVFALLSNMAIGAEVPETVFFQGKYYRDAKLRGVTAAGMAEISSLDGKTSVPITSLPASMKAEATAWQKRKAQQEAERATRETAAGDQQKANAGTIQTVVRVISVLPDGILATTDAGVKVLLKDHPDAKNAADGEKLSFRGRAEGVFSYETALGTKATARIYRVVSRD